MNKNLLSPSLLEALQLGKTLRENADYYAEFSQSGAKDMLDKAKEFLDETRKILQRDFRKLKKSKILKVRVPLSKIATQLIQNRFCIRIKYE